MCDRRSRDPKPVDGLTDGPLSTGLSMLWQLAISSNWPSSRQALRNRTTGRVRGHCIDKPMGDSIYISHVGSRDERERPSLEFQSRTIWNYRKRIFTHVIPVNEARCLIGAKCRADGRCLCREKSRRFSAFVVLVKTLRACMNRRNQSHEEMDTF